MQSDDRPPRSGVVLATLVTGAVVANVNLSIANVALPDIGRELGADQVQLTMVASMFTMGLAASVLYLGALGDRYGRKLLLLCGAGLSIPSALVAGFAPNVGVLVGARLVGGIAAGLLFPTTLSLIAALWRGAALTRAIAIWSGFGGMSAAVGSLAGGFLLEHYRWGSVFLISAPVALLVLAVGFGAIPWRAGEKAVSVDHLGGVLSVVGIALLIVAIQGVPNGVTTSMVIEFAGSVIMLVLFFRQQDRARHPLVDLGAAGEPTFWVAATAGTITFGSLIGAMFLGQQFTQNVLGYTALQAAEVTLPMPVMMLIMSFVAARLIRKWGSRVSLSAGICAVALGFVVMLVLWDPGVHVPEVLLGYGLVGTGVGLAATASSHSLMASLPVSRAGMGSAFTDLTRDFGGAIMQSAMGALLAIVYADSLRSAFNRLPPSEASQLTSDAARQIIGSFEGAEQVARGFPQAQATELTAAAAKAFTEGKTGAYSLGLVLTLVAMGLVMLRFPRRDAEFAFYAKIERRDRQESAAS